MPANMCVPATVVDLPRERTGAMGPIKRLEDFDPVYFRETFRFTPGEFTEILSNMRDLDGDLGCCEETLIVSS